MKCTGSSLFRAFAGVMLFVLLIGVGWAGAIDAKPVPAKETTEVEGNSELRDEVFEKLQSPDWKVRAEAVLIMYGGYGISVSLGNPATEYDEALRLQIINTLELENEYHLDKAMMDEYYKVWSEYVIYYRGLGVTTARLNDPRALKSLLLVDAPLTPVAAIYLGHKPLLECLSSGTDKEREQAAWVFRAWTNRVQAADWGIDPETYLKGKDLEAVKQGLIKAACNDEVLLVRGYAMESLAAYDSLDVIKVLEGIEKSDPEIRLSTQRALEKIRARLKEKESTAKSVEGAQAGSLGRKPQEHAGQQETKP